MRKRFLPMAVACLTLMGLTLSSSPFQGGAALAQTGCQTFPETGKTVCGTFLQYWKSHGGLAQQGYPISGEFQEKSDVDGKSYTVQYFERAVFELHPENKPPFDVLLSLLGTMQMAEKYPNGVPAPPTAINPQVGLYFPETQQYVSDVFLDYWKAHGGVAQQGYPISGRFSEKSDIDGKLYTVQYFERAVFELHSENGPDSIVLLSQLGTTRYQTKYPTGAPGTGATLKTGQWGGQHVRIDVTADGTLIEFDCAHATIAQPITLDSAGNFDVTGIFVQEHGGPVRADDEQGRPARFTGSTDGTNLNIAITYTDDNTKIGAFSLVYGAQARIVKCL
ncbi:MAG: hypothetical protein ABI670_04925 [Chloroflexota bacterium]